MDWTEFVKNHKIETLVIAILVLVVTILFVSNLFSCSSLNEEQCRQNPSCIPLGKVSVLLFEFEHDEVFDFEQCVDKVEKYDSCNEVVKLPQNADSTKFSKECSCCCGKGTVCEEKPYPET